MTPKCIWFTGLSGSGKSTLALALYNILKQNTEAVQYLDGDIVRHTLCQDLGFTEAHRMENIRRVAHVNVLLLESGVTTINAFISPTEAIRNIARDIIGQENMVEIYLSTPLSTCETRDPKGLYVKARSGLIPNFTGIDAPFEPPLNPHIIIDTAHTTVDEAIALIISKIYL
jgi:adenylyl-sulfate kinase